MAYQSFFDVVGYAGIKTAVRATQDIYDPFLLQAFAFCFHTCILYNKRKIIAIENGFQ